MRRIAAILIAWGMLLFSSLACSLPGSQQPTAAPVTVTPEVIEQEAPTAAPSETVAAGLPASLPELTAREINESSQAPRYTIEAGIPFLEGDSPAAAEFNRYLDDLIQEEIASFRQAADEAEAWRAEHSPEIGSGLYVSYTVTYYADDILSVLLDVSNYYAGAAHPNSYAFAVNFDLSETRILELDDLFIPSSSFLEIISDTCIQELERNGVLDAPDGAAPRQENYRNWNIAGGGLLITFDPYQVAPYAAGPQKVTIPYEMFRGILKPDGPISFIQ